MYRYNLFIKSEVNIYIKKTLAGRYFYFTRPSERGEGEGLRLNLLFDLQPTTFHQEITRRAETGDQWGQREVATFSLQIARGLQVG